MTEREDNMDKQSDNKAANPASSKKPVRKKAKKHMPGAPRNPQFIETLQYARRDFLAILDSIPALIWYRDRDGTILRANQRAADYIGVGVRDLIGKNYFDLVPREAERARQQDAEVIHSGCPLQGVLCEYQSAPGTKRWMIEDRIPLRSDDGQVVGVMMFVQDVTDKKRAEENLLQAKQEIELRNEQLRLIAEQSEKLAEQASRSNLAKSEILASSSHDLRTPMNAVIGFADLLLDTPLDGEQQEYVKTIQKSANGLLSLINDILDFTKLEAGKLNVQIIACEAAEFMQEIRALMEPGAVQKGLAFELQIDPRLPRSFFTDPIRLRQCLVNLLGNAVKFTGQGKVCLTVRPDRRGERRCIRFDVEDTGIGISKDKQSRIFGSYIQAEDATEKTYGGTGLGLTITRRLVDLLGGHIVVISEPGKGSIFSIILPLIESGADASQAFTPKTESEQARDAESRNLCRGHILVADANLPGQLTMNLLLRRVGLSVDVASTPQQLFEKATLSRFDIIILDLTLDKDRPIPVIEKLHAVAPDTPLVAIAPGDLELMKKALAAGCSKYLTKPVSRRQLYETLFELIQQAEFEKKLKKIVTFQNADSPSRPAAAIPAHPESGENTFEPEELVKLLLVLISQLPGTFDQAAMDQIAEVVEVLGKVSAFCDNPQTRQKIRQIEEHFQADLESPPQNEKMLAELEQICRDIHEACEKKSI